MDNYMLNEVLSMPKLIAELADTQAKKVSAAVSDEVFKKIKKIYIFGSGDSYNAAVTCEQAFACMKASF